MSELPETRYLELHRSGEWLCIWFNRPAQRNALAKEMTDELMAVFSAIKDYSSVRGVSLRGRGGVFCAGGDLKAFGDLATKTSAQAHASAVAASLDGARLFRALHELPQFTLAVVEGAAMAGGMGLASAADVTIAAENAKFALTETRIGLIPAQIAPYLVNRMGVSKTAELMLTGQIFVGTEAARLGLAHHVTTVDGMDELERKIIDQVLSCAPGAIAATKALMRGFEVEVGKEYAGEAAIEFAKCLTGAEGHEGIASFLEKRQPKWVRSSS